MKLFRRTLLQALVLSPLAANLSLPAMAQGALSVSSVTDNISVISGAGANVVVAVGPESVVVVDGGLAENAEALLAQIDAISAGKPISTLFNTNWRRNKSGLNQLLAARGTSIIAHENTRLWQNAEFHSEWENVDYTPLPKEEQANKTFYDKGTLTLGDEVIEYGFISQSNSDSDIYVRFTKADVLVVGDMVGAGAYPLFDYATGGWINGAQRTTQGLLALSSDTTRVIASLGPVVDRAHLEKQAAMLEHAYAKVSECFKTGLSLEQFKQSDPMQAFNAEWGNPDLFLALLYKSTWYRIPGRAIQGII
jgi:cyclase